MQKFYGAVKFPLSPICIFATAFSQNPINIF
jgi:hypothetical protein